MDEFGVLAPNIGPEKPSLALPTTLAQPPNKAAAKTMPISLRRSTRDRKSVARVVSTMTDASKKRKRVLSVLKAPNIEIYEPRAPAAKKQKVGVASAVVKPTREEKKAKTFESHQHRDEREKARKRWFSTPSNADLITAILPHFSITVVQYRTELAIMHDTGRVLPYHTHDKQPTLVKGGAMRGYQLEGLSFLAHMWENGVNCILGDEMGLGKTLQTLSLLAYIKEQHPEFQDPHLVVCPLSVLSSWCAEAKRWVPDLVIKQFHGQVQERQYVKHALAEGGEKFDIMIATYETFQLEKGWMKSRRWNCVVLDEGHKIKNSETQISTALQGIGAMSRIVLTGTPVQNNLSELWSMFHFLFPQFFTEATRKLFERAFSLEDGSYQVSFMSAVQAFLKLIMLRRTKGVVEATIPDREEHTVWIPMSEAQKFWYFRLLKKEGWNTLLTIFGDKTPSVESQTSQGGGDSGELLKARDEVLLHLESESQSANTNNKQWSKLMGLLMQLRRVCDHPYILPHAEPEPYRLGEHIVAASSKLIAIDKILGEVLPKGEKVLIFSQWTKMLDVVEDYLTLRGIGHGRLDGSTSRPRRTLEIKLFQQDNSPFQVFIASTLAGGLGITLTKATTVIMCDSNWNPQHDLQAIARAHRIGQTKTVKVYRLICRASVEDQMLDRIRRKLFLSVKIMGSDPHSATEGDNDDNNLGGSELLDILRRGTSAAVNSDDDMSFEEFLKADWSTILEASKKRQDARDAKIQTEIDGGRGNGDLTPQLTIAQAEEERLLKGVAKVQTRLFEGAIISTSNSQIRADWEELQGKREHTDRLVKVNGILSVVTEPEPHQHHSHVSAPSSKPGRQYGSEDWCIYCRDGGNVYLCHFCPRVFHAECFEAQRGVKIGNMVSCPQHECTTCLRKAQQAGGMLFRCQTCPRSFCEDCLPVGDIEVVGDTIPEFLLLDYGEKVSSYYVRCHHCRGEWAENPASWKAVKEEMDRIDKLLEAKYQAEA